MLKGFREDEGSYPASDEDVERVGESVTDEVATPPAVVERSTRGKRSKKDKVASVSKTTAIASVWAGRVNANGCPSGASYAWDAPGEVVQVAAEDVDAVMGKNRSGTRECCGAGTERIYFVLAD